MFAESGNLSDQGWDATDQSGKQPKYLKRENARLKRIQADEMLSNKLADGGS
jgi:hypothetical protein